MFGDVAGPKLLAGEKMNKRRMLKNIVGNPAVGLVGGMIGVPGIDRPEGLPSRGGIGVVVGDGGGPAVPKAGPDRAEVRGPAQA